MDTLIKGLKKPEKCESCPFEVFVGCMFRAKQGECPLRGVRTPHGRLIDADEFRKVIEALPNCYNGFSDTYDKACIIGLMDEQPTIIEAEEGGRR